MIVLLMSVGQEATWQGTEADVDLVEVIPMFFSQKRQTNVRALSRKLSIESLEDRRVLATMVVTDLGDDALANLAGDGLLSLREAVEAINTGAAVDGINPTAGAFGVNDTILFSAGLFGGSSQTIALTAGQLELASGVTIAGPFGGLLTIDGQGNSRIFDIALGNDDFVFDQMTLTGGLTTGFGEQGGAIRSMSTGQLSILNSQLIANATTGSIALGGAVGTMGAVVLKDSSVTDNRTEGLGALGGGVFAVGDITATRSTIAANQTMGGFANGAGVSSNATVSLHSSTVSRNRAMSSSSGAGGILAQTGVELTESTVSGNQSFASGGGISTDGVITVTRSTIVDNQALGANATGGGLRTTSTDILVTSSIIANNSAGGGGNDIATVSGTVTVDHSLIGDSAGLGIPAATNLLDIDPLLGPLSGGGLTETHAPLPGSPVIDAGDASFLPPPANDQRGGAFQRVADGDGVGGAVIDMGSHEVQAPATADFDRDGDVDGFDFLAWQRGFGQTSGAVAADGNSDEDSDVDRQDLAVWQTQYGSVTPLSAATVDQVALLDAAIVAALADGESDSGDSFEESEAQVAPEVADRDPAFAALAFASTAEVVGEELAAALGADDQAESLAVELDDAQL